MQALTPSITVAGKEYLMVTPQLAGISARDLGRDRRFRPRVSAAKSSAQSIF